MNSRRTFLFVVVLMVGLMTAGQAFADYNVTISSAASVNGTWSGGTPDVWTPNASGSNVSAADIQTKLAGGDVTMNTTGSGTESGDIVVSSAVSWSVNTLTLNAARDINVNAVMTASGSSLLTMTTGGSVNAGFAPGGGFAGRVDFDRAGTGFLNINSWDYTVINSLGAEGSTTRTDLQGISGGLSGKYALGANIDVSATSSWNSGAGFLPLGNSTTGFTGVFDGLGHTVNGIYINRSLTNADNFVGLFGYTNAVLLRNVGLVNGNVSGTSTKSGTGSAYNYVGGLVAKNTSGSISNSYNTGSVFGSIFSSATGATREACNMAGGLVGFNSYIDSGGTISNSYNTGSVFGNASSASGADAYNYSGGLVGYNCETIINSYNTGSVIGTSPQNEVGGLLGQNASGSVINSYNTGSVFGNASGASGASGAYAYNYCGGLVGHNWSDSTVINSYSIGSVSGSGSANYNFAGGLAGADDGTISNSFWNTDINSGSCGGYGSCGTGKTTTQMKSFDTFTGWDISATGGSSAVWRIYDGYTYPLLRGFLSPLTVTANDAVKTYDGNPYSGGNGMIYSPSDYDRSKVFGTLAYTGSSQGATTAGTYAITPGGAYPDGLFSDQLGYNITYASGTLTINPAPIAVSQIIIDPATPTTLYAGLDGAGVYKKTATTDWTAATTQPTNNRVKALVIKPGDSTKLYAATYGGGVFKSTNNSGDSGNNGLEWTVCANTGLTNLNVVSLTIDANGKLYAGTEAGVFMSTNDCATWTAMNNGLPD